MMHALVFKSWCPALDPPFRMTLAIGLSSIAFIMLTSISSRPTVLGLLSKAFFASIEKIM